MSEANNSASGGPGTVPYPYVSFKTLTGMLDKLAAGAIPPRLDKSMLDTYSGGTVAILLSTLRMMDLIHDDGTKTENLEPVVRDEARRRAHFKAFVQRTYGPQLALAEQDGTSAQLLETFDAVKGTDTKRKAILFYLAAVEYTGLPNSQYFKAPKQAAAGAKRKRRDPAPDDEVKGGRQEDPGGDGAGDGETIVVPFGDLGAATLTVSVKWLSLPDEKFTGLRKVVRELKALGYEGDAYEGDDAEDDDEDTDP